MADIFGPLDEVFEAYAAIKIAGAQLVRMDVGEQTEADIPDIDLRFRKGGKQFKGRIISVVVERDG